MDKAEKFKTLNQIYKPLVARANKILNLIKNAYPSAKLSFYNGHYTKVKN